MTESIYLDNNATTPLDSAVLAAMQDCMRHCYGNPSSKHHVGAAARERLIAARIQVAALLGCAPGEVVFTSGATESNHMAIMGALAIDPAKRHIVSSAVEHPSTLLLLGHLAAQDVEVTLLPVDGEGRIDLDRLASVIRADTALVSLMWANNETGVLFPIAEAAAIAKSNGVIFHTDAVQVVGKIPVDVEEVPVDLLSLSGHKLHAAKGVGALYIRKGLRLPPLFFGNQERKRRGGTENLIGIVGLGVAAALAARAIAQVGPGIGELRDVFERGLLERMPQTWINGASAPRVPGTSNLRFAATDAEIVLDGLDKAGVCASSGSACTAGGTEPSHVLVAMGQTADMALASVRFSFSRFNTVAEVERLLELLPGIVGPRIDGATQKVGG
uniref:cysteine desulfurase n=2 Tax=root TaxID=1 RepID=M1LGV7_9BACT|nr:aminotransferase class V [uncultured prokaryote]AGF34092.1 aminotransferase class V [uncultured bacterium DX-1A-14]